jgi:single-stranded DNA-specific DHH superfamily exonuclease
MLTKKQVEEIKEHLEKAQNPLFFFDNDNDGLCSFLLLQRYIGRGKGIPIKSFPELTPDYFRKIRELNADYIFILDKPVISKEFFKEVEQINVPIVWIDHHIIDKKNIPDFVNYYNPLLNNNGTTVEPTTYLCYQVSQKKRIYGLQLLVVFQISLFLIFIQSF